jgi:hypothetical protein
MNFYPNPDPCLHLIQFHPLQQVVMTEIRSGRIPRKDAQQVLTGGNAYRSSGPRIKSGVT